MHKVRTSSCPHSKTTRREWFLFDEQKASHLLLSSLNKKEETVEEVHATFKPKWVDDKLVRPKLKADGTLSKVGLLKKNIMKELATKYKTFHEKNIYKNLI